MFVTHVCIYMHGVRCAVHPLAPCGEEKKKIIKMTMTLRDRVGACGRWREHKLWRLWAQISAACVLYVYLLVSLHLSHSHLLLCMPTIVGCTTCDAFDRITHRVYTRTRLNIYTRTHIYIYMCSTCARLPSPPSFSCSNLTGRTRSHTSSWLSLLSERGLYTFPLAYSHSYFKFFYSL